MIVFLGSHILTWNFTNTFYHITFFESPREVWTSSPVVHPSNFDTLFISSTPWAAQSTETEIFHALSSWTEQYKVKCSNFQGDGTSGKKEQNSNFKCNLDVRTENNQNFELALGFRHIYKLNHRSFPSLITPSTHNLVELTVFSIHPMESAPGWVQQYLEMFVNLAESSKSTH